MAPRTDAPVKAKNSPERLSPLGIIAPPPIQIESPKFNGSLATLFVCVRDRKVDLLDVPLFPICEAYFAYLLQSSVKDIDEAAAALAALSYLLERKAWSLLPVEEPEPEAEEALELLVPTAQEYRAAIDALRLWQEERDLRFFRPVDAAGDSYEIPLDLGSITIQDLARSLERVLSKAQPEPLQPLGKARRSLSEEMKLVLRRLSNEWRSLEGLLPEAFTKTDAVYGFLALLELIRLGQVALRLKDTEVQFTLKGAKS
jgi:segregation and condensation protein A